MESRSADLGAHSGSHWKFEKIEHEKGLKFGPPLNENILMQFSREFKYKFIEVSDILFGIQFLKLWNLEVQISTFMVTSC